MPHVTASWKKPVANASASCMAGSKLATRQRRVYGLEEGKGWLDSSPGNKGRDWPFARHVGMRVA